MDLVSNLAISLYNVGTEEEYLKNNEFALINYQNATDIAINNLGPDNLLTIKL